jgi:hypothetical protein
VRWDNLFDDLEGQLENELNAEEVELRAEEERLRLGRLALRQRLTGVVDGTASGVLRVVLVDSEAITLRPTTFGRDWLAAELLGAGATVPQCILPFAAIAAVLLAPAQVPDSLTEQTDRPARLVDRIGLPFVLRDLCRRRKNLQIRTGVGTVTGTIDRVGRDHLDLAVHAAGTSRRAGEVQQYRIVPLHQICLVRLD